MEARSLPALLLAASWLAAPDARAEESPAERIVIAETAETFQLSVPASQLVMSFPRGAFVVNAIDEETDGPRYFSFSDTARGAMMTGWFEPAHAYVGIEALWKGEVAAWKKAGLPKPRRVEFVRIGRWEAVLYDLDMPHGSNTHIRAQWTELGTWIDLHISVTSSEPIESARKAAQDILAGVQVAAAKVDGDMSSEEKKAVLREFERTLGLKHRVATDLLGSGAYLLGDMRVFQEQVNAFLANAKERLSPAQAQSVIAMMESVAGASGSASGQQNSLITATRDCLDPASQPKGTWG